MHFCTIRSTIVHSSALRPGAGAWRGWPVRLCPSRARRSEPPESKVEGDQQSDRLGDEQRCGVTGDEASATPYTRVKSPPSRMPLAMTLLRLSSSRLAPSNSTAAPIDATDTFRL